MSHVPETGFVNICPDCTKARAGPWGGYTATCHGCLARLVAVSPQAFNALDPRGSGDRKPLGDLVDRVMEGMSRGDAVRLVREWFKLGLPQREGSSP